MCSLVPRLHATMNSCRGCNIIGPGSAASIFERQIIIASAFGNYHSLAKGGPLWIVRMWWDWFAHTTRCKLCCCTVVYTNTRCLAHDVTHYLHCLIVVPILIARMSAHHPVWAQGKVHCPWALFHETTVTLFYWALGTVLLNLPRSLHTESSQEGCTI